MSVAKTSEITAASGKSFEDAVQSGIKKMSKSVDNIEGAWIKEQKVIVDDGEILVLGGLIEDTLRESEQRVPVLGRIPILGNLFRSRKTDKVKTNLLIFIRPKIIIRITIKRIRCAISITASPVDVTNGWKRSGEVAVNPI